MALIDEVQSRYSTPFLVTITNPQASATTTLDITTSGKLYKAAIDIIAKFKKVGITYDNTVDTHVMTGVEGVVALLRMRQGQYAGADQQWKEWLDELDELRMTTANNRVIPTSSSELTPTDENPDNNTTTRPHFDGANFTDLVPGARAVDDRSRLNL